MREHLSRRSQPRLPPGPGLPPVLQTALLARHLTSYLRRCQKRYGDLFTVRVVRGELLVFVADPGLIRQIFTGGGQVYRGGEHNAAFGLGAILGPGSVLVLDDEEHRRTRALMAPPFQPRAVRRYEDVIAEVTREEMHRWPVNEPFAMYPRMQSIVLEVILRTLIGVTDDERYKRLRELLPLVADFDILSLQIPALMRVWPWRGYARKLAEADRLLLEEISARRQDPGLEKRPDVLSALLRQDGLAQTDRELRDTLLTFLIGGHETTATSLAWTFERLARHPRVLLRLRDALENDDDDYFDAVVRETLRIRPVINLAGRKLGESVELGGYHLPAGANVLPAIGLVHESQRWYDDALAYRPERFLEKGPSEPYTWIPFGGGARRCPGSAFAAFEVKTVLKEVLAHAELAVTSAPPERPVMRHVTLVPDRGAQAKLLRCDS